MRPQSPPPGWHTSSSKAPLTPTRLHLLKAPLPLGDIFFQTTTPKEHLPKGSLCIQAKCQRYSIGNRPPSPKDHHTKPDFSSYVANYCVSSTLCFVADESSSMHRKQSFSRSCEKADLCKSLERKSSLNTGAHQRLQSLGHSCTVQDEFVDGKVRSGTLSYLLLLLYGPSVTVGWPSRECGAGWGHCFWWYKHYRTAT